jgi:hypothetical protein
MFSSNKCLLVSIDSSHIIPVAYLSLLWPIPVAAWSKVWVCGRSLAWIADSNPAGIWMSVSCECCVLSGRGLCFGLIARPEKFYRVWCVEEPKGDIMI